jgi:dienelactone hydrolase
MYELQTLTCKHGDVELNGQIATPNGTGPHPAVLVMHTALGLGTQMRRQASLLAEKGYAAVATDMYGRGRDHHANPAAAGAAYSALLDSPQLLRDRTVAWHSLVRGMPNIDSNRVAAIGYCFGGRCVLELARSGADVKAVVSYHGLLDTSMPAKLGAIKGVVAVYTGAKDPYAPTKDVDAFRLEMMRAQARWHITVFGDAAHGFTDPDAATMRRSGIAYDALADRISWAATLALLETELRSSHDHPPEQLR